MLAGGALNGQPHLGLQQLQLGFLCLDGRGKLRSMRLHARKAQLTLRCSLTTCLSALDLSCRAATLCIRELQSWERVPGRPAYMRAALQALLRAALAGGTVLSWASPGTVGPDLSLQLLRVVH